MIIMKSKINDKSYEKQMGIGYSNCMRGEE